MTTPNNPTPPPGMEILTDYTMPLPEVCYCFGESNQWLEMASIADRDVNYPFKSRIYAIPITHPATGDTTNEKGGEPCLDLTEANALTVSSNAAVAVPSHDQRQLLPCPFCGNPPTIEKQSAGHWVVFCANSDCNVIVECQSGFTKEDNINRWNARK